ARRSPPPPAQPPPHRIAALLQPRRRRRADPDGAEPVADAGRDRGRQPVLGPVGLLAVSGPGSGTPSEAIMRAMFGTRGNRVNSAIIGWFACVFRLALNWAAASLAAFSLAAGLGAPPGT